MVELNRLPVDELQWEHEGIGTVRIYRDKGGNCVDINGKRAWSAWRESVRMIELSLLAKFREYKKLKELIEG